MTATRCPHDAPISSCESLIPPPTAFLPHFRLRIARRV